MTRGLYLILAVMASAVTVSSLAQERSGPSEPWDGYRLWYSKPAESWDQGLPVGNGRLGAMVLGYTDHERIQFNEETLWSGGPYDPTNPGGYRSLPEIRRLLFDGEYARAHDLFGRSMMGIPFEQMKYQSMGDLWLHFPSHTDVEDYRRELDLDRATVVVRYRKDGVTFTRQIFSSAVDQVIVVHISADRPGAVTFTANLHGMRNPAHSNYGTDYFKMDGLPPDELRITGKSSDYLGIEGKLRYEARLSVTTEGGTVRVDYKTLSVDGADSATIILAGATSFVNYRDVSGDPRARVQRVLDAASERSYEQLKLRHIEEYRSWFRRVAIDLGHGPGDDLPTDERIARLESFQDPQLAALYFQFGRYLLISSSRPGTQPANLQGIWNESANPPWDSKYTVNINLPMNYWPAEVTNLSELTEPLEGFLSDVSQAGQSVAREHWGASGWVLHQNSDLWRATAPMDGPSWGAWPIGGAWLTTHLWEHYQFTGDRSSLIRAYPVLRGSAQFLSDILVEYPGLEWLVTAPSNSPENFPAWPGNGRFFDEVSGLFLKARTIAAGPTMDMQVIREVFSEFIEVSELFDRDRELRETVRAQRSRLAPNQIGKHGQLQEWIEDFDEIEPEHRHLSHLWGLFPGTEISVRQTPDLAAAAAESIRRRGTGGCGWSYAWKIGLWARLGESEPALHEFNALLRDSSLPNLFSRCGRALQVDGNFGATAGIAEMLVQSHEDNLYLLPALPEAWHSGTVSGLRARRGFELDFTWIRGELDSLTVLSLLGNSFRIELDAAAFAVELVGGTAVEVTRTEGRFQFPTEAGKLYRIRRIRQ